MGVKFWSLPRLYHKGKNGQKRQWSVWAEGSTIFTEYGDVGGKLQLSEKVATGKNAGRSNETTPEEQATIQAKAMWQHKLDRKYSLTLEETATPLRTPMLAHTYEKKATKVSYPVDVQPKLDGIRCMARCVNGDISLISRSGKPLNVPHIVEALQKHDLIREGEVLDGELFAKGLSFQEITKRVKKVRPNSSEIEYHVYDIPEPGYEYKPAAWDVRRTWLEIFRALLSNYQNCPVVAVDCMRVEDEQEMYAVTAQYVAEGYEGSIVRLLGGTYLYGYRSTELLKVKKFTDSEFTIRGVETGVGKFAGCAIFVCGGCNGDPTPTFKVTPTGTMEERRQMYQDREWYIGKTYKVKYFELTDGGVPRFPVGLGIREDFDR